MATSYPDWVLDMDREKCFERAKHNIPMERFARPITDQNILCLFGGTRRRASLSMESSRNAMKACHKPGHLPSLISNILLDELDKALECGE